MEITKGKNSAISIPRLLIAAPQGLSGKSVISIGLCAIFHSQGLKVQPFKKGPDYIDPSWLSAAAGLPCRNLDPYLMTKEQLTDYFLKACVDKDIALTEGAMGFYDSIDRSEKASSADLARMLAMPVILVVNTAKMTTSVAAMVKGFQNFEPDINIAGIILNNVSGSRHETKLREAIECHCDAKVLGAVPRDNSLSIRQRHLGLVPFKENNQAISIISRIQACLKTCLDIDTILTIAQHAMPLHQLTSTNVETSKKNIRIGVMCDPVFTFYYTENLEALRNNGAELVSINSLTDEKLPEIDGLYIGGGFPEFFLEELEANNSLRNHIAGMINHGLPVYAECAGLMYLCKGIRQKGRLYQMAGVIPAEVDLHAKPQGHGYAIIEVSAGNPWFPLGTCIKGHEFHYSRLSNFVDLGTVFTVKRGHGIDGKVDGIMYKNMLASYLHINALGAAGWAEAFTSLALNFSKNGRLAATYG
jgi:cobyrinic acid a,c-diamide synthase